jgi:hypothetical protein
MRTLTKKLSSYCLAVLLATGNMTYTASAYAAGEHTATEHSAGGAMLADAVLMRIPMTLVTVVGAGIFVVTLPFSAIGGNVGEAGTKLVKEPFEYAWVRPLGEL